MKQNLVIFISSLILFSCSGESENTEETPLEETPNIIGHWKGENLFWEQDGNSGNGLLGWDYIITKDSIFEYSFPYTLNRKTSYIFTNDSISFSTENEHFSYKYQIEDSLLSLVGYIKKERDSLTFSKTKFDGKIIAELNKSGFNLEMLKSKRWKFNYDQTKKYNSPEIDTNIYHPPSIIDMSADSNKYLSFGAFLCESDTFYFGILDEYYMILNTVQGKDTFELNYDPIPE